MLLTVTQAQHAGEYRLQCSFSDGTTGTVDLAAFLQNDKRKVFRDLLDATVFRSFSLDFNTITWPNEADLAPEFLKELMERQQGLVKVA